MNVLLPSDKIYLSKSKIAGRGVFAKVKIKKDEIIEVAPVIVIPYEDFKNIWNDLYRYVFRWGVSDKKTISLAMGFGSFYNHSKDPNAVFIRSLFHRILTFTASKDIEKDEEITINYGYEIIPEMIRP